MTRAMKLIDANLGLMECRVCGYRHRASIADGGTRYVRGSWKCSNDQCPSNQKRTSKAKVN
jgi:hypothetical protein